MTRWWRDPVAPSLALFGGIAVVGFVAIGLGWRVAARTLYVQLQLPVIISGLLAGVALVGVGAGMAGIQVGRRLAAAERAELDAVLDVLATAVQSRTDPAATVPAADGGAR